MEINENCELELEVEVLRELDDADASGMSFTQDQLDLIANLELLYYGELAMVHSVVSEGLVINEAIR